jgi:hypothetical protein
LANPATSLYCGQCGAKLQRSAAGNPEPVPPQSETEAVALAKEEAERKRRTEIAHWKEIELESRGIFMPWNRKDPASEPASDAPSVRNSVETAPEPALQPPVRDTRVNDESVAAPNMVPQNIVQPSIVPPNVVQTNIAAPPRPAGPAGAWQYRRKHAGASHSRRNLALAVVVGAAAILAAFQWSFLRDSVVPYVENELRQARRPAVAPPALTPPAVTPAAVPTESTSPAAVKNPSLAAERPGVPSARGGDSTAPGAAEMYQAAHASDVRLRAAWLWKAVRAGNPQATVELARMYADGDGVAQNCDQARLLLSAAAAKGNVQAKLAFQQFQLQGCSEP